MGIRPVLNTGNTFNGLIKEFPGLGVDRFNTIAKVYLLTHCHSDHLCGLRNKSFDSIVYCSETTKKLITLDPSFRHVLPLIIPIETNVPFTITLNGEEILLTLIPAYHCPGATMFLIEGTKRNILYTGDMRAESWWVETLSKNPSLFPYTAGLKVLDNIYLDTTFIYRGEPFIEIPLNNEGISVVTLLIKSYPTDDPDVQFYFVDSTSGFEEAWAQIANSLQGTLHTNEENKLRIELLHCNQLYPNYGHILNHLINKPSNSRNLKFHACGKYLPSCKAGIPKFPIRIKQCIDFNILDFTGVFCPINLSSISSSERICGLKMLGKTVKGNIVYEFRGRRWLCKKDGDELLPADIKLIFSRHSSYSECRNFVSKFKFRDVYPCTESKNTWQNGMIMSRLFGDLVYKASEVDITLLAYDKTKSLEYGTHHFSLLNRPIKVINRWNFSQCVDEIRWVKNFLPKIDQNSSNILHLNSNQFNFEGQKFISKFDLSNYTEDEKQFHEERHKDMQLQKIVVGRGEAWYRKIIENQQKLYFKFHNDIEEGVRNVLRTGPDSDTQFNDGMKLGGTDRYNYDNGSILDELTDEQIPYDSPSVSHKNIDSLSVKFETNDNDRSQVELQLELSYENELTDIEDESDDMISVNLFNESNRFGWELKRKKVSLNEDIENALPPKNNFKRPCLKRINKNNNEKSKKSDFSFIESSFNSFEISFRRQIIGTEDEQTAASISKNASLLTLTHQQTSFSKTYFKSCASVNSSMIKNVSDDLNNDPANWFSLKLKSVDTQFNQVTNSPK